MSVLTLPDVKPYLGKLSNTDDAELESFIAAAEAAVVNRCGPLVSTATTSTVAGSGTCALVLPVPPVISVTSVTGKSGSTVTVERVSGRAGVVYAESAFSESYYTVVYQAGWAADAASVPADLVHGTALEVQLQWQSMRGTVKRGPDDLRPRIDRLLGPYMQPGFA